MWKTRQVSNGYTIQFNTKTYQIARSDIRAGLRGAAVRVEVRLDGSMAVRFRNRYLAVTACQPRPRVPKPKQRACTQTRRATRQKPMDGELPPDQPGENRSVCISKPPPSFAA